MNGQEALDIHARQNDIQLILLDINTPVTNGLQFLGKASQRGITQRIPVIVQHRREGRRQKTPFAD